MAFAFDTRGFAKHLRERGVPQEHAEAHAEAVRQFVMVELVTKTDLQAALDHLALRLTVRFGAMLAGGLTIAIAILTITLKLT